MQQACAAEVGAPLQVAPSLMHFSHPQPGHTITVGLAGDHQVLNASLAVALVRSWEQHSLQQQQQADGSTPSSAATAVSNGSNGSNVAAVAAAAAERLKQLQSRVLPLEYCQGLEHAAWAGRSQVKGVFTTWVYYMCGLMWGLWRV